MKEGAEGVREAWVGVGVRVGAEDTLPPPPVAVEGGVPENEAVEEGVRVPPPPPPAPPACPQPGVVVRVKDVKEVGVLPPPAAPAEGWEEGEVWEEGDKEGEPLVVGEKVFVEEEEGERESNFPVGVELPLIPAPPPPPAPGLPVGPSMVGERVSVGPGLPVGPSTVRVGKGFEGPGDLELEGEEEVDGMEGEGRGVGVVVEDVQCVGEEEGVEIHGGEGVGVERETETVLWALGGEEMVEVGKGKEEERGPTEVVPPPPLLPLTVALVDTVAVPPPCRPPKSEKVEGEGEAVTRPAEAVGRKGEEVGERVSPGVAVSPQKLTVGVALRDWVGAPLALTVPEALWEGVKEGSPTLALGVAVELNRVPPLEGVAAKSVVDVRVGE